MAARQEAAYSPRGNDPFSSHRFSIHRYSVRHTLIMSLATTMTATAAVTAATSGNPLTAALAAGATVASAIAVFMMVRAATHRTKVEAWIRRLGMGDYEYSVAPTGHDELSKVCVALENLRMRAIEATEAETVRRLSRQVRQQNQELEEALTALRHAQDAIIAQKKLAGLGELTAGVAHEMRNPLNFILNYTEAIISTAEDLLPPPGSEESAGDITPEHEAAQDIHAAAKKIIAHCNRAERIVSDMLQLRDNSRDEFTQTDLNQLVTEQAQLAYHAQRNAVPGFNTQLAWELDPTAPTVEAKPSAVAQLIINIVTNACHAVHERSRHCPGHRAKITVTTIKNDGHAVIQINDNGTGMDAETLEKMFNPFFTTKEPGQGTGLGMAISHDIVQEHSGNISPQSTPGQGSTITITLPTSQPKALARAAGKDQEKV